MMDTEPRNDGIIPINPRAPKVKTKMVIAATAEYSLDNDRPSNDPIVFSWQKLLFKKYKKNR